MTIFLVLMLLLLFIPSSPYWKGYDKEYLSKDATAVVKGLFILLVFATHFVQYVKPGGVYDNAYLVVRKFLVLSQSWG